MSVAMAPGPASTLCNEAQAPTGEMAVTPPSIRSLPDDVRRIVRREVNCQLRDFQRIGHPPCLDCWSEDLLNRWPCSSPWKRPNIAVSVGPGLMVFTRIRGPRVRR